MDYNVTFPLYVCLDDGEIIRIESFDRILYELEAVDIENDEYMFWDAHGRDLKVLISKGRVSGFDKTENKITLQQAFHAYARQLADFGRIVDISGPPEAAWAKLERAKESLPPRPSLFSRLFRRGKN